MMKKWLGALIVVAIFLGGSFDTYRYYYMGETYYTKITTNGERHTEGDRKTRTIRINNRLIMKKVKKKKSLLKN